MPCAASVSISASSLRWTTLYMFCSDDVGNLLCLFDFLGRDVAQADMADQPLLLELRHDLDQMADAVLGEAVAEDAQVDHVQRAQSKVAQIVRHGAAQLLRAWRGQPFTLVVAARADLGDQGQLGGIGMQRLLDDLIGDMRAIEVGGVDVVDAGSDGGAQYREAGGAILGRTEHARAGQLHGAIAHASDGAAGEIEIGGGEGAVHRYSPWKAGCSASSGEFRRKRRPGQYRPVCVV